MLAQVEGIRKRLDDIDARMIAVLAERFDCIDELAERKVAGGLQLRDEAREQALLRRVPFSVPPGARVIISRSSVNGPRPRMQEPPKLWCRTANKTKHSAWAAT